MLLTPVAKAFASDIGVEVASLGIQVHGGMGYIEETGAAMLLRDARIGPIYEGTNGIQAIDLVTRKISMSGGEPVRRYIAELMADVAAFRSSNPLGLEPSADRLAAALEDFAATTEFMQRSVAEGSTSEALAGATPYLRLFALAAGGAYLARACVAEASKTRIDICRFYADNLAVETMTLKARIIDGARTLVKADLQ